MVGEKGNATTSLSFFTSRGNNTCSSREEEVELGIPAPAAAKAILVLPPAVVHNVQIVGGTPAEYGSLKTAKQILGIVEKRVTLSTIDVVVAAPGGVLPLFPRNVRIDFPNASAVVAASLETRREPFVNVDVEDKSRAVLGLDTGTHGFRSNALGAFMPIETIVGFDAHMVLVGAVGFGFGDKAFALALGPVLLGGSRLQAMAMVVLLSDQAIVSSRLAPFVVLMGVVVPGQQNTVHHQQGNGHKQESGQHDESCDFESAKRLLSSAKSSMRDVLTDKGGVCKGRPVLHRCSATRHLCVVLNG
jgi:hypothetical protein